MNAGVVNTNNDLLVVFQFHPRFIDLRAKEAPFSQHAENDANAIRTGQTLQRGPPRLQIRPEYDFPLSI